LVEATRAGTARLAPDHHLVVVGMGINLDDARALSTSLNRRIADWSEVARADSAGARVRPEQMVARIARAWYENFSALTTQGFEDLPERYTRVDGLVGRKGDIIDNDRVIFTGNAAGGTPSGQLLLRDAGGEHPISVREVAVRAAWRRPAPPCCSTRARPEGRPGGWGPRGGGGGRSEPGPLALAHEELGGLTDWSASLPPPPAAALGVSVAHAEVAGRLDQLLAHTPAGRVHWLRSSARAAGVVNRYEQPETLGND